MTSETQRLIVVSNRLPVVAERVTACADGALDSVVPWRLRAGSGGLVSALVPVLKQRGGTWIGWPGVDGPGSSEIDALLASASAETGYSMQAVHLTQAEIHEFYQGFSNEIVWPLFHDLQSMCNFDPAYWRTYQNVNRKYAAAVAAHAEKDDLVWVHDYHLMNVGAELRALDTRARLGFFLHVPFPSLDLFAKLPWCSQLILALLQYDLIGFQTTRDRGNFVQCVRALVPQAVVEGDGRTLAATLDGRRIRIGAFPISIDFDGWVGPAHAPRVQQRTAELRQRLPDCKLVLGIDRLDYTKGIPYRLQAFYQLLRQRPEFRERLSLVQVVVPSRVDIPEYDALKNTIEQLVGRINGEFMKPGGWVPVWYMYGHLSPAELVAYYRAADIALVTPLRDGMNLVAKEYCASNLAEDGVLVLSEFAGAAAQLRHGALLVNPYDIEGVADALAAASTMPLAQRRARMAPMRHSIRRHDVHWWTDTFLEAAKSERTPASESRPAPIDSAARALRPANDDMPALPALALADAVASGSPRTARMH